MILNSDIREYIRLHREDDVRKLALQKSQFSADMHSYILQQIAGWQVAKKKVPSWASVEDIQYPVHLSLEQCSSEQTARYKASLLSGGGASYVDLTGGMGVDFSFMAKGFVKASYVEQNEQLCDLAANNFPLLNLNVSVNHTTSEEFLNELDHADVVYLDPARRDDKGRKVVSIADCTPNLLEIKDTLLSKSSSVWIKYSPMLDISLAIKELQSVDELHVVSLNNECKELLFHLTNKPTGSVKVVCVNLKKNDTRECFEYVYEEEHNSPLHIADEMGCYLYEPNASIMKAGAFKSLTQKFRLGKLAVSSHLYTSNDVIDTFPGRRFRINEMFTMNKQQVKEHLGDCKQANVSVRNFPLSADKLKSKLKLTDGGDVYLFATTFKDQKILLKTSAL